MKSSTYAALGASAAVALAAIVAPSAPHAQSGVPHYVRVPTVSTAPSYIAGLARLVREAQQASRTITPDGGKRRCAPGFTFCGCSPA